MGYDFQKIAQLIAESGMSQKYFFSKIGMSDKTFSSWVNGTAIPKEASIQRIASQLGVTIAKLRVSEEAISSTDGYSVNRIYPKKNSSNFWFLERDYADVFTPAKMAETNYSASNYDECVFRLGVFAEGIVDYLIEQSFGEDEWLEIKDSKWTQDECIKFLYEQKQIDVRRRDILNELRTSRNNNAHFRRGRVSLHSFSQEQALTRLTKAFELAKWFAHENDINVENLHFNLPVVETKAQTEKVRSRTDFTKDYTSMLEEAEQNEAYGRAILYAIILRNLNRVKKNIAQEMDESIKSLGELYILLRSRKHIPPEKKLLFSSLETSVKEVLNDAEMTALRISFIAAYRHMLYSLSGSINQIVGDLD